MFRNFFIMVVGLFIPEDFAQIEGVRNGAWFDLEKARHDGPLSRKAFPESRKRVGFAFDGWAGLVPDRRLEEFNYARDLAEFADLWFGIVLGKIGNPEALERAKGLEVSLRAREPNYPEVAALLTVDQLKEAAAAGQWT